MACSGLRQLSTNPWEIGISAMYNSLIACFTSRQRSTRICASGVEPFPIQMPMTSLTAQAVQIKTIQMVDKTGVPTQPVFNHYLIELSTHRRILICMFREERVRIYAKYYESGKD